MPRIPAIASFTTLTRLELSEFHCSKNLERLQNLGLRELVLVDCPGAAERLIVPGALTALQKLHISQNEEFGDNVLEDFSGSVRNSTSAGHEDALELIKLGQAVLGLPRLVQLSGWGPLFLLVLAEELKAWKEIDSTNWMKGEGKYSPIYCSFYLTPQRCWVKESQHA